MVTGIESVGLVLAIIPLIIEALKSYLAGIKSIENSRHYILILNGYKRSLSIEQTKFTNTWRRIIELIDPQALKQTYPEITLDKLLQCPQALLGLQLRTILSLALTTFDETAVENFEMALNDIRDLLEAVAVDFLEFSDAFNVDFGNQKTKRLKDVIKMLKVEIKGGNKTRDEQLSRIRQLNEDLSNFVSGEFQGKIYASVHSHPPSGPTMSAAQTKLFNIIRGQAQALHIVLQRDLAPPEQRCCEIPHEIVLRLEARILDIVSGGKSGLHEQNINHFRFSFVHQTFGVLVIQQEEASSFCVKMRDVLHDTIVCDDDTRTYTDSSIRIDISMDGQDCIIINEVNHHRALESEGLRESRPRRALTFPLSSSWIRSMVPGGRFMNRISRSRDPRDIMHPHQSIREQLSSRPRLASTVSSSNITGLAFCSLSLQGNINRHATPGIVASMPETEPPHDNTSRIHASARTWNCRNSTLSDNRIVLTPCAVNATKDTINLRQSSCLGILSGTGLEGRICECNSRIPNHSRTLISLRDLILMQPKRRPPSMLLRLKLAVLLASSVMQLHGTGWLKEFWSSKDIFFEGEGNDSEHARLDQPLVRGMFNTPHDIDTRMEDDGDDGVSAIILFANPELFSLGIVLIELHHWKPFNELQRLCAKHTCAAVVKLVEDLGEQAGSNYQSAVQTCIQGLGHKERKLENEDFKKEVYEKVVAVLEADLKHFCKENDLQKVFRI